tara:strand:+ start:239 stop:457 length:219 start_codon:yes stop_codon:yes gene_type:complete
MKLELIKGELNKQEKKDVIRMLDGSNTGFGFGVNRTYKNLDKANGVLKIRVENTLVNSSERFRNVFVKQIYK